MYKNYKENLREVGFTLVELLVVMGIIALLSGISIFALQSSRGSARDARRKGDLETIKSGLELYKSDCGSYPSSLGSSLTGTCPNSATYIQKIPTDPSTGNGYCYNQITSATYELCTNLENDPATSDSCGSCDSGSDTGDYKVTNP